MALLGFQLITTLIGSVFLSKIVAHSSFTRYIYSGLKRRAVPTNSQILEASGNHRIKSKGKKRKSEANGTDGSGSPDVFYFPRTVPLKLESCRLSPTDVSTLPLYSSFQWLLDFTMCTMGVYLVTEIAQSTLPLRIAHLVLKKPPHFSISGNRNSPSSGILLINNKLNLSLMWLTLALWFTVRTLLSMTGIYFRSSRQTAVQSNPPQAPTVPGTHHSASDSDSNAEWFLVLSAAFIFLILSGFFLALDGRHFDFGLASGYANLTMNTTVSTGVPWMSWGAFHIILAATCATIGALLVYPGLKFGRIYLDAVSRPTTPWHKRLLFHLTFISPLLPILLWIKPVTDHLFHALTQLSLLPTVVRRPDVQLAVSVACELLSTHLDTVRLLLCVWVLLLRVCITRWCLQVYLDSAQDKLSQLNREPGRISNREVQRLVASVYYCINLVALQWLAPTILLWAILCLYKSTANLSWIPSHAFRIASSVPPQVHPSTDRVAINPPFLASLLPSSLSEAVVEARWAFHQFTNELGIRASAVLRSVLGFFVWWCLVALQSVTLVGLAYHRFASG